MPPNLRNKPLSYTVNSQSPLYSFFLPKVLFVVFGFVFKRHFKGFVVCFEYWKLNSVPQKNKMCSLPWSYLSSPSFRRFLWKDSNNCFEVLKCTVLFIIRLKTCKNGEQGKAMGNFVPPLFFKKIKLLIRLPWSFISDRFTLF